VGTIDVEATSEQIDTGETDSGPCVADTRVTALFTADLSTPPQRAAVLSAEMTDDDWLATAVDVIAPVVDTTDVRMTDDEAALVERVAAVDVAGTTDEEMALMQRAVAALCAADCGDGRCRMLTICPMMRAVGTPDCGTMAVSLGQLVTGQAHATLDCCFCGAAEVVAVATVAADTAEVTGDTDCGPCDADARSTPVFTVDFTTPPAWLCLASAAIFFIPVPLSLPSATTSASSSMSITGDDAARRICLPESVPLAAAGNAHTADTSCWTTQAADTLSLSPTSTAVAVTVPDSWQSDSATDDTDVLSQLSASS